jgi:glutathione synthase/RimK-type ligase-like ATP-grasp enzyme
MGIHQDRGERRGARRVVLVLTNRGDYTADWLILELQRRNADVVRFNTEDWPTRVRMEWEDDGGAQLALADQVLATQDVHSVWYRRPVGPVLQEGLDDDRARWATAEAAEALHGLWRTLDAKWVNPPLANSAASSKPEQIRRARRLGFRVPQTLITNDPEAARAFAAGGPTICKPLSQGLLRIDDQPQVFFTRHLSGNDVDALDELGPEPYLFQRLIEKRFDVRVVVIGTEAFAARIDSQGNPGTRVDWRRADATMLPHARFELPEEVSQLCVSLVEDYGLLFGAIDLAVDQEGRHVFFEVNPAGQWAWIEQLTGQPLRSRLASLLVA